MKKIILLFGIVFFLLQTGYTQNSRTSNVKTDKTTIDDVIVNPLDETWNTYGSDIGWVYESFGRYMNLGVNGTPCILGFVSDINTTNSQASAQTPLVEMGNNPSMSFAVKVFDNDAVMGPTNPNYISYFVHVSTDGGTNWDIIHSVLPGQHTQSANFQTINIDVSAYKNQLCLFKIVCLSNNVNANFVFAIDNAFCGTLYQYDLETVSITGNPIPIVDTEETYTVKIVNKGKTTLTSADYNVILYQAGGVQMSTQPGVTIAPNQEKEFVFSWTPTVEGPAYLYGYINFPLDEYPENNTTYNFDMYVQNEEAMGICVGNGTELKRAPIAHFYRKSLSQTIYYPYEIESNEGVINSLLYKSRILTTKITPNRIKVWLCETEMENLADDYVPFSEFTEVFDGVINFPAGDDLNVIIPFQNIYHYNGGNLVVYIYSYDSDFYGSDDLYYCVETPGLSRTRIHRMDGTGEMDYTNPGSQGTLETWNNEAESYPNTCFIFTMTAIGPLNPVRLNVEVDGCNALFSWNNPPTFTASRVSNSDKIDLVIADDDKSAPIPPKTGAFIGYNVYLNDEFVSLVEDEVFEFTDLDIGVYTAGVQAVYTSGVSDIIYSELFEITETCDSVGIKENVLSNVTLYPNPFTNEINISNGELIKSVQITNVVGQKVSEVIFNGKSINTSNLGSGIYFITLESFTGEKLVHKMIKK